MWTAAPAVRVAPVDALQLARAVAQMPRCACGGVMSIMTKLQGRAAQLAVHLQVRQVFDALRAQGGAGFEAFDTCRWA